MNWCSFILFLFSGARLRFALIVVLTQIGGQCARRTGTPTAKRARARAGSPKRRRNQRRSWGSYYVTQNGVYTTTTISQGPWIAGYTWTSVPYYGCNPFYYYCYPGYGTLNPPRGARANSPRQASVSTWPVYWQVNNAAAACAYNNTAVYALWSGPNGLNLCSQTPGPTAAVISTAAPSVANATTSAPSAANGTTSALVATSAPSVTTTTGSTSVPTQVKVVEAFSVMSTVFVFFAAVLSCMDAASDSHSKLLAGFGAGCSFLTMVWSLVAWAQWAAWDYIIGLQFDQSPKGTPLWLNPSTNAMTAVQINMSLGPGFACQVAGWCLRCRKVTTCPTSGCRLAWARPPCRRPPRPTPGTRLRPFKRPA